MELENNGKCLWNYNKYKGFEKYNFGHRFRSCIIIAQVVGSETRTLQTDKLPLWNYNEDNGSEIKDKRNAPKNEMEMGKELEKRCKKQ